MKVLKDYSFVKGVCHYIDGDREHLRRELGYGGRVGLNSVRVWLWDGSYFADKSGYISSLVSYVRSCHEFGYTVMPILFNGNGINPDILEPEYYERGDEFARAVVNALKDEPGLIMWDVMNEPACSPYIECCPESERGERLEKIWTFVRHYCRFVKELDPVNAITVGYTTAYEAPPTVDEVDVISFHDYHATRAEIRANYDFAKALSEKTGKPVMNTETGCLARANPYDLMVEISAEYGWGWYLFELMIHDRCDTEHGIFYPDGTVRDPATIAAITGCYRKRSGDIIPPLPNREGMATRAVEGIKRALSEYTSDAFDYRRSDLSALLEACEAAANLLEGCDMTPMAVPPTFRIEKWRSQEKPDLDEVRSFAYSLALRLKELCQLL